MPWNCHVCCNCTYVTYVARGRRHLPGSVVSFFPRGDNGGWSVVFRARTTEGFKNEFASFGDVSGYKIFGVAGKARAFGAAAPIVVPI